MREVLLRVVVLWVLSVSQCVWLSWADSTLPQLSQRLREERKERLSRAQQEEGEEEGEGEGEGGGQSTRVYHMTFTCSNGLIEVEPIEVECHGADAEGGKPDPHDGPCCEEKMQ